MRGLGAGTWRCSYWVIRLHHVLQVAGRCGVEVPDPHARSIADADLLEIPQVS
jgi:hypothetical protein